MWSPIDRPVRGSTLRGADGTRWPGRIAAKALARSTGVRAALARSSALRSPSLTAIGASEAESTPPAMPDSTWPRAILLATRMVVSRLVPQACWTS